MKYYLCVLLILASAAILGGETQTPPAAETVYVRLIKVTHGAYEVATLFATFEPIRFNSGFGAGGGYRGQPRETEIAFGKPFTVEMLHAGLKRSAEAYAHKETLVNVIRSCEDVHKPDTAPLKLHLVLSIPADQAKEIFDERDFSQWVIQSVGAVH